MLLSLESFADSLFAGTLGSESECWFSFWFSTWFVFRFWLWFNERLWTWVVFVVGIFGLFFFGFGCEVIFKWYSFFFQFLYSLISLNPLKLALSHFSLFFLHFLLFKYFFWCLPSFLHLLLTKTECFLIALLYLYQFLRLLFHTRNSIEIVLRVNPLLFGLK